MEKARKEIMRKQRLIAGILVMVMLLGLLPTVSLAAEGVDLSTLVNIAPQATLKLHSSHRNLASGDR